VTQRNDLTVYDTAAPQWWSNDVRWIRTLQNMVPARMKWFSEHFDWRGKAVLDLGCAGGFMAEALAQEGADVTGIDPAADAIRAARQHAQEAGLGIDYDIGVGEELPYPDAKFDAVVCVDVLEHVADLDKVISEVARVLKPGRMFLFDTINRNAVSRIVAVNLAEDLLRILPKGTHDPALFIKPTELREKLDAAGLEPGAFTGLGPRGLNRRGDAVFGQLPFTTIIYMGTATKSAARKK
jgi:2-polyprenyl-6-hydroxyphenyl methylase/3-demethylubiquinone-9 3-methyltransferase